MQICYFYLTTILHWICPLVCSLCALALFDLRYQYVPSCQLLIAICCKNVQIKYGTQTHFCTCSKLFKMIQTSKLLFMCKVTNTLLKWRFLKRFTRQFLFLLATKLKVFTISREIAGLQVNLFQEHLFLHQLTHNMTKDCSLNYKLITRKLQAQNMGRTCCVHKLFFVLTFRAIYAQNMFSQCSELVVYMY